MLTMETMLLVGTAVAIALIPSVRADCIGCSVDYKCGASISKICCKLPATSKPQPYIYIFQPRPSSAHFFPEGDGFKGHQLYVCAEEVGQHHPKNAYNATVKKFLRRTNVHNPFSQDGQSIRRLLLRTQRRLRCSVPESRWLQSNQLTTSV